MNAVKEIVRLRGGIENLNPNRLLRIIIFWYTLLPTILSFRSQHLSDVSSLGLISEEHAQKISPLYSPSLQNCSARA